MPNNFFRFLPKNNLVSRVISLVKTTVIKRYITRATRQTKREQTKTIDLLLHSPIKTKVKLFSRLVFLLRKERYLKSCLNYYK